MVEGIPLYLNYRVLDPVSGAELIHNLPHLHQSTWEIRGYQPGATGGAMVGVATVPLFPPLTDQYAAAQPLYSQLAYGQRIEGYPGDIGAGDPKFTGYITSLPSQLNSYQIGVQDSTWLAVKARTDRSLAFNNTTDILLKNSLKAYGLIYGDDTWASLSGYTNNGNWALASGEVGATMNGVTAGASGDGLLYTTASYTNAQYADCVIDGVFKVTSANVTNHAAQAGIIAAIADASNFILGQVRVGQVSSGHWQYQVTIFTKVAGVYTQQSVRTFVYDSLVATLRCQPRLFGTQNGANYTWRLVVNGYDQGCTYTYAATPSGAVGFRSNKSDATISDETCFATNLCFQNKQSIFAQGSITGGSNTINQTFSRSPLIDLWNTAAGTETFQWRKNPKAGLFADTVDFASSLGTDLSGSINGRFEEGINLVDVKIDPNAEPFATEVELNASPGNNNQGSITWHNIAAQKTYGVISESVSDPGLADPISQFAYAKAVATKRGKPGVAKTITVVRDPQTMDKWRELDTITVHSPSEGLFNQAVVVQGYRFTEGLATQEIIGDQYPLGQVDHNMRRLIRTVDALANRTASVTGNTLSLDLNGNPAYDGSGVIGALRLVTSASSTTNGTQGPTLSGETALTSMTTPSFTLSRQTTFMLEGLVTGAFSDSAGIVVSGPQFYMRFNGSVTGAQTNSGKGMLDTGAGNGLVGALGTATMLQTITLLADTYTATIYVLTPSTNTQTLHYWDRNIFVYQTGA